MGMKEVVLIIICIILCFGVGCKKEEVEVCTLTQETEEYLTKERKVFYLEFIRATIDALAIIRDENTSYEDGLEELQKVYDMVPVNWVQTEVTPEDKAISFFMITMDAYMGCRNYSNYADCKDDLEKLINDIVDEFEYKDELREDLSFSEERFKEIYDRGKEMDR